MTTSKELRVESVEEAKLVSALCQEYRVQPPSFVITKPVSLKATKKLLRLNKSK